MTSKVLSSKLAGCRSAKNLENAKILNSGRYAEAAKLSCCAAQIASFGALIFIVFDSAHTNTIRALIRRYD